MKTSQKGLLHLLTAELCTSGVGVDNCPGPAMLKSMAGWISEEAAQQMTDSMFSHVLVV